MKIILILLKLLGLLFIFLLLITGVWWFLPARTPKIKPDNGVAKIEYILLGGTKQCVLTRSHDKNNPILLFLHGGPGMPMMYMAHEFQRDLEENFTIVQWDRRGAGKSYSLSVPSIESMNVRQILNDCYTLIDTLRSRYKQDKIVLVGHSFGTYLGSILVSERPELFDAFVSIGQVVDDKKARILQEEFIRTKALENNCTDIVAILDTIKDVNFESWLFEFGGELKNSKTFFPLIWSGLKAPEYTVKEAMDVAKGSSFSSMNMKFNVLNGSILDEIIEYKLPVFFFVGKSDYTTPWKLAEHYFNTITAPQKEIIYFENSAHFPFFEEPEKFCKEVNSILKKKK